MPVLHCAHALSHPSPKCFGKPPRCRASAPCGPHHLAYRYTHAIRPWVREDWRSQCTVRQHVICVQYDK